MSFFGSGNPSGFSFGSGDTQNQQQQQQVRFGSPAPAQGGFTFGTPTQGTAATPSTGLFGAAPNTQTPNTGFSFGGGGPVAAAPTVNTGSGGGFTFGTPNTATSTFGTRFAAPNVTANVNAGSPMASIFSGTAAASPVAAPTATSNAGFAFGATAPAATSSPFGAAATSSPFGGGFAAKPATISFGTPGTGFTFGQTSTPAMTTASAGSFGLSGLTSTASASTFGSLQTNPVLNTAASVPSFGPPAPTAGFNFGGTATTIPQNKGLTFGAAATSAPAIATPALTSQATGGLQFVSTAVSAPQTNLFGMSTPGGTSAVTAGVKLGGGGLLSSAPSLAPTGGLTFGLAKTTPLTTVTSAPALFGLATTTSTSAAVAPSSTAPTTTTAGFSFGAASKPTTTTTTSGLLITPVTQLAVATTSSIQTTLSLVASTVPSTQSALTTTTSTMASVIVPPPAAAINFRKLEEDINKWTVELEEQERVFLSQATQVNAWDRILISNGEKITRLNDALERVKLDQEHLDQEIDFIHSQQNELEELLAPLEKSVETLPTLSIHQHADLERERTFQMAENIDSQLRLMSRDLKDVIDHLNSTTGTQDSNDPIQQIGKILNSHMDSLQWIDQNTNVLRKKVDEVARVYEICRQDKEKGLQLPYM